jgi:hypothetical protein
MLRDYPARYVSGNVRLVVDYQVELTVKQAFRSRAPLLPTARSRRRAVVSARAASETSREFEPREQSWESHCFA